MAVYSSTYVTMGGYAACREWHKTAAALLCSNPQALSTIPGPAFPATDNMWVGRGLNAQMILLLQVCAVCAGAAAAGADAGQRRPGLHLWCGPGWLCGVPEELQVSVHVCLAGGFQGERANQSSSETPHTVLFETSCQLGLQQHSVCSFRGTLIGGNSVKTVRQRSGAAGSVKPAVTVVPRSSLNVHVQAQDPM